MLRLRGFEDELCHSDSADKKGRPGQRISQVQYSLCTRREPLEASGQDGLIETRSSTMTAFMRIFNGTLATDLLGRANAVEVDFQATTLIRQQAKREAVNP